MIPTDEPVAAPDGLRQPFEKMIDARKRVVADEVTRLSSAVDNAGRQYADRQGWIADALARGAAQIGSFADQLRERPSRDLAFDLHRFALRQPIAFLGGALLTGFAAGRLLRLAAQPQAAGTFGLQQETAHD